MVTSSTKSSWRQVTSDVIQGSLLVLILFNSFTPDLKWCDRVYLGRFTDDAKLGGAAETPHSCVTMWDLDKLENCFKRNLMNFNKGKCKVLKGTVESNKCRHHVHRGPTGQKEALQRRPLGSGGQKRWSQTSSALSQKRRPTSPWVIRSAMTRGQSKWTSPSIQYLYDHSLEHCTTRTGLPSTRKMWTKWSESSTEVIKRLLYEERLRLFSLVRRKLRHINRGNGFGKV